MPSLYSNKNHQSSRNLPIRLVSSLLQCCHGKYFKSVEKVLSRLWLRVSWRSTRFSKVSWGQRKQKNRNWLMDGLEMVLNGRQQRTISIAWFHTAVDSLPSLEGILDTPPVRLLTRCTTFGSYLLTCVKMPKL